MAGMRITIGTALRARDVSRPDAADEEAARQADAAAAEATNATPLATPPRPAPRKPREPHRARSGGGQAKAPG